ncbi:MAG: peptidyl-prolyl cis-trans isomerase [Roseburia sp.]|nr:peptidyl-prolyl cis-trans isomerase [Roseburia sp.]
MRKKRTVKTIVFVLGVVCMLSGCRIGNVEITFSGKPVTAVIKRDIFTLGGTGCEIKEAKVYLSNYQNIYGTAYGIDLWQHDFGDDSLVQYVKNITLQELTQIYGMNLLAESKEVTLSEEELADIGLAAEAYYESLSEEEISYLEVSKGEIKEYYRHYALARKLYHSLTEGVDEEVSDDEARVMEIMQIFVSSEEKAEEVLTKLKGGEDFATVASNYNELTAIQINVSRDDLPPEAEEVAFQMNNGEVSGSIEVENGYYFIRCMNKFDEELTEANKVNIVEKRQKEALDDVYHEFMDSLTSNINEELWESLTPDTSGVVTTDSFFKVFEKYCGEM